MLAARCAAARVLDLDLIGSDLLDLIQNETLAGQPDGDHQNYRCRSHHHAQRRERKAQLAGPETIQRQLQNLAQHHGAARALQRLLKAGSPDLFESWHVALITRCAKPRRGFPIMGREAGNFDYLPTYLSSHFSSSRTLMYPCHGFFPRPWPSPGNTRKLCGMPSD